MPTRFPGLALLVCLPSIALAAPAPVPRPPVKKEAIQATGQTVILGTWSWKVVGNRQGGIGPADVFWEQVTDTERNLVPQNGAGWAVLKDKPFDKVTREDLEKASYSTGKLSGAVLRPGTVVALRTHEKQFAKLRVIGYRTLHDTSFPEASLLDPAWVQFARGRPNTLEYHLEVGWVLYKAAKETSVGTGGVKLGLTPPWE